MERSGMRARSISVVLCAIGCCSVGIALADTKAGMIGRWKSISCETRPGNQHIKRDMTIRADGTWTGFFEIFSDEQCRRSTSSFRSGGVWRIAGDSVVAADALEIDFTITKAHIDVRAEDTATYLNTARSGSCGTAPWAVGQGQDITATGCSLFGLTLPSTEGDIIRASGGGLYLGERPSGGSLLPSSGARPTGFQVPMFPAK